MIRHPQARSNPNPLAVILWPLLLGLLLLLGDVTLGPRLGDVVHVPVFLAVVFIPLAAALMAKGKLQAAALSGSLLTPLALGCPWTMTPGLVTPSFAGSAYFFRWLTKYPNFGPINYEVLLGTICLFASSVIPWLTAAWLVLRPVGVGRRLALVLVLSQLVVYVPVLLRLDWVMLAAPFLWPNLDGSAALAASSGAVARLLGTCSLVVLVAKRVNPDW